MAAACRDPLPVALTAALVIALVAGHSWASAASSTSGSVGLLLPSTKSARWAQNAAYFVRRLHTDAPTANVVVLGSDGKQSTQLSQATTAIKSGAKVLVVAPINARAAARIITKAHHSHVQVIGYDRPIKGNKLDLYTGFDQTYAGRLEGRSILNHVRKHGRLVFINGPIDDDLARAEFDGYYAHTLQAKIRHHAYISIGTYWTNTWSTTDARWDMVDALFRDRNRVQGVLSGDDVLSQGVIKALRDVHYKRRVWITGAGATLAGLRSIIRGQQGMTVYEPGYLEASAAADAASSLLAGKPLPSNFDSTVDVGYGKVRAAIFDPIAVTRSSIKSTVIKDKFMSQRALCKGIQKLCRKYHI